jgi:sec-independent protein translocase protein TatB
MFDIGWQELFIVAVLAIIVIGPKDLPSALRTLGRLVRKARGMASEFQTSLEDMARDVDLEDVRKELDAVSGTDIRRQIEETIDPTGTFVDDMGMDDIQSDMDASIREAMAPPDSIAAGKPQVDALVAPPADEVASEPAPDAPAAEPVPDAPAAEPPAAEATADEAEPTKANG